MNKNLLSLIVAIGLVLTGCDKEELPKSIPPKEFNASRTYGTMTDQDGNTYKTIKIGTQTWMAENLKTTKYRNGEPIPEVTNENQWMNLKTGAYCSYENNKEYKDVYGLLYNGYVISEEKEVAPEGWHIATQKEWYELNKYLGDNSQFVGRRLKEAGFIHWNDQHDPYFTGGDNDSGFTALPGGWRRTLSNFQGVGYFGHWLYPEKNSNEEQSSYISLNERNNSTQSGSVEKSTGMNIRCVKD